MAERQPQADGGDVVSELRDWAYIIDEAQGRASILMLSGEIFTEAADVIGRLRAAGDALVAVLRSGSDCGWDAAIDAWEDCQRG